MAWFSATKNPYARKPAPDNPPGHLAQTYGQGCFNKADWEFYWLELHCIDVTGSGIDLGR